MKILIIHNRYKFEGGEEGVVSSEASLLSKSGHEVFTFEVSNKDIDKRSMLKKALLPLTAAWSWGTYRRIRSLIKREKPDVAHVHNTFFLMSPSVYDACRHEGVPVVQTLHNYRFFCPAGISYRNGRFCRDCLDKGMYASIKYDCGQKDIFWKAVMLTVLKVHSLKDTFRKRIDSYICLSNFSAQKFIDAGFDREKIHVKPNFIEADPGYRLRGGSYALYVGRISHEKGIDILIKAWEGMGRLPLKIIGSGASLEKYKDYAREKSLNIEFLGRRRNSEVFDYIRNSLCVVLPSRCNENFPRTIVEAFSCAIPVVASNAGAMSEIISDGKTGLLFNPEDPDDLNKKVNYIFSNHEERLRMCENARLEYESKYTAQRNLGILTDIYKETILRCRKKDQ